MASPSSPIGGGKFMQFVDKIMEAEREPIRQIEKRKAKENERLKLMQDFVGKVRKLPEALRDLDSFKKFRELKAEIPGSAKELMDVIVDKDKAEPGDYDIEVVQLAGRHSMISEGYKSPTDEIGVGYFTYDLPNGDTKSIWIGPGNNTLAGLVAAINAERGAGVTAAVLNDGSGGDRPFRIVVTGKGSGMDNDMEFPDFYFLDGDFKFKVDEERSAQNAIIKFNGFEIMSPTNKFELLPGVTIDLKEAKEGHEFNLSINQDIAKVTGKVKAMVDSVNAMLDFIYKQNKLDASSDTSRTLGGDTALFTIESKVRSLIFQGFNVDPEDDEAIMHLSDIGVRFEKTGQLAFNEDKFKKMLTENFDYVASFFADENNLVDRLKFISDGFLRPETGAVTVREKGIKDRIRRMDDQIATKERQLGRREEQLKRQFSQLEAIQQNMQQQQAYMQQALGGSGGAIPGM